MQNKGIRNEGHSLEEIYSVAGKKLTDHLLEAIEEKGLVDWFYRANPCFDNQSPYDICKNKDKKGLERLESMIYYLKSGGPA